MQTLLSGLNEQACLVSLDAEPSASSLRWLTAVDFLAAAESSIVEQECLWVWLYRAPWVLVAQATQDDVTSTLEKWQVEQRAILKLRRHLGPRLLLVNIDQISPLLLCERIGLPSSASYAFPACSEMSPAIAALFEYIAPHYWDLFELLEATAWLPEGEPLFRHSVPTPGSGSLFSLLQTAKDGLSLATCQIALVHAENQNRQLVTEQEKSQKALTELTAEVQSLNDSSESFQAQLHQVQEELEKHCIVSQAQTLVMEQHWAASKKIDQKLSESEIHLGQANALVLSLKQEQERSRIELTKSKADCSAVREENSSLLAQLHRAQDELETNLVYIETNAAWNARQTQKLQQVEHAVAEGNKAANNIEAEHQLVIKDNKRLLDQLLKAQEELETYFLEGESQSSLLTQYKEKMAKVEQALKSIEHTATVNEAEQRTLLQENELLQAQLLQVQDEIESYYEAHCEMQEVMDQSHRTMHRARIFVSQLMCDV